MDLSKNNHALLVAHEKGYKVTHEGQVVGPQGKVLKLRNKKGRGNKEYKVFSVHFGGRSYGVKVHRLAAYQKFGAKMFEPDILVRHMDDDAENNRPDNLRLGTHERNMIDKKNQKYNSKGQVEAKLDSGGDKTVSSDVGNWVDPRPDEQF